MHALYSNHIGYNETPTLTVLNGPPSWVVRSTSKNGRSEARYRQWACTEEHNLTMNIYTDPHNIEYTYFDDVREFTSGSVSLIAEAVLN